MLAHSHLDFERVREYAPSTRFGLNTDTSVRQLVIRYYLGKMDSGQQWQAPRGIREGRIEWEAFRVCLGGPDSDRPI